MVGNRRELAPEATGDPVAAPAEHHVVRHAPTGSRAMTELGI
jgi:hypothetical protein